MTSDNGLSMVTTPRVIAALPIGVEDRGFRLLLERFQSGFAVTAS
jgi:hypothetical protein